MIILFNKPFDVLSQFTDKGRPGGKRETLSKYIDIPNIYPAGRLDRDSEGLLVLTDNGRLQAKLSHPRHKIEKTYLVQVEGEISDNDLTLLREGLLLRDGICKPAKARVIGNLIDIWLRNPPIRHRTSIPDSWIELTITEGRNRQIRRMTAAIGFPTLRLIRTRIGKWTLKNLGPGNYQRVD